MFKHIIHQPAFMAAEIGGGNQLDAVILLPTRIHSANAQINHHQIGAALKHHLGWAGIIITGLVRVVKGETIHAVFFGHFISNDRGTIGHAKHSQINFPITIGATCCISIVRHFKRGMYRFIEPVAEALNAVCLRKLHTPTLHMMQQRYNYNNAPFLYTSAFGGVQ